MAEHGGFEHNLHGLRIIQFLEYPYASFPGLNLSWEVQEALALHSRRRDRPEAEQFTGVGQPLLEAQVADAADSLAYDAHDVDDALSVGLITAAELAEVSFWRRALELAHRRFGDLGPMQFQSTVIRTLIDWQVSDLLENTRQRLRQERIHTIDDVRHFPQTLVEPGPEVRTLKAELEAFLHRRVYQHYRVQRMAAKGRRVVQMLFAEFCRAPQLLTDRYFRRIQAEGTERVVCDYLAGMTDRYALDEYLRLFQPYTIV
jgi:dGTPase